MPVLSNPKHEIFAQELAKGKTADEAYVLAGYKEHRGNAATLRAKQSILDRMTELLERRDRIDAVSTERAINRLAITKEAILGELAKIGFANMADYMRIGPDGDPCLDFSALTRDQSAALVEVTVEDFKDGRGEDARDVRRVKFKLADKKGALVDLGKHLGLFIERHEHGAPGDFDNLSDADLEIALRDKVETLGVARRASRTSH